MTLKTTKKERNKFITEGLLFRQLTKGWLRDLCHDANRAEEFEKEVIMHTATIRRFKEHNNELRAKLNEAYERAAKVVERGGREESIRALKDKP